MTYQEMLSPKARMICVTACIMTAALFALTTTASADTPAESLQFIIVSDDIRKQTTEVARPEGSTSSTPGDPGSSPTSAPDSGTGKGNNGHGNNADGVDSSNPGQGGGGPNGGVDPSGDFDDEAGGGGASPSQGKGKKK